MAGSALPDTPRTHHCKRLYDVHAVYGDASAVDREARRQQTGKSVRHGAGGNPRGLRRGRDTIADFKPGEDKINLFQVIEELAKNANGSSSPLSIQASGRDATISLGGTVKAILKGVSANQVSLSDFEFDNKLEDLASTLGTDAF